MSRRNGGWRKRMHGCLARTDAPPLLTPIRPPPLYPMCALDHRFMDSDGEGPTRDRCVCLCFPNTLSGLPVCAQLHPFPSFFN